MSSGFEEFGFGSGDNGIGTKSKRFKARADETYRLSFGWWEGSEDGKPNLDAATPKFIAAVRGYRQGAGFFVVRGKEGSPEYKEFEALSTDAPKKQVGTVIIVWPTTKTGAIDPDRLKRGDYDVHPWLFSPDKYTAIGTAHADFHLGKYDLKLTCTDAQFQKMTFMPCGENLLRKMQESPKSADLYAKIVGDCASAIRILPDELAKNLTLDQLRQKILKAGGQAPAGARTPGSSGPGLPPGVTGDVDKLLEDVLG